MVNSTKITSFCILLLIFVGNVHAGFSVFKKAKSSGDPAFYGKTEAGNLTIMCKGEKVLRLTAVSCVSETKCAACLPCLRNPKNQGCEDIEVGSLKPCPSPFNDATYSKCLIHEWKNWGDSLTERLYVDRYLCTMEGGREIIYDHFAGLFHQMNSTFDLDVLTRENILLRIFKGSSALVGTPPSREREGTKSNTSLTQVVNVNLFSSEVVFVQCRVPKGIFEKPVKSPVTARHTNGSFVDIGPAPETRETLQYWEYSYPNFTVGKEMTSISCAAKKTNLKEVYDWRTLHFNVTEPEFPVAMQTKTGVKTVDASFLNMLQCKLWDLFTTQKNIFFQTAQDRGLNISKNGTVTSVIDISRLIQLAKEMHVEFQCQSIFEKINSATDFFIELDYPRGPQITNPSGNITKVLLKKEASVTIRCEFKGIPTPYVTWLRNDQIFQFSWGQLNSNETSGSSSSYYSTLDLPPLPQKSSGSSPLDVYPTFSCVVSNFRGIDRRDFVTATIPKIRRNSTSQNSTFEDIVFTWRKEEQEANMSIECIYKGGPTTFVKWMHNGIILDDSVSTNTVNHSLEYSRSELMVDLWAVEGRTVRRKYTCIVSNNFGRDSLEFRLVGEAKVEEQLGEMEELENSLILFIAPPILIVLLLLAVLAVIQWRKIKAIRPRADQVYDRMRLEQLEKIFNASSSGSGES